MWLKLCLLFFTISAFFSCSVYAQHLRKDSLDFNKSIGQQSRLYNGPDYAFYPFNSDTSAYFKNLRTFEKGTVIYDGYRYSDIPLLYDLYKDLVITLSHDSISKFSLLSERVSDFYQADHHFIRVERDTTSASQTIATGFYDLVYDGKIKVLVKRFKNIQEAINSTEYKKYFVPGEDYFLLMNRTYYKVNSEGSFMSLFKKQKKEMQRYLKSKGLKYRKNTELALQALAGYYDNLPN